MQINIHKPSFPCPIRNFNRFWAGMLFRNKIVYLLQDSDKSELPEKEKITDASVPLHEMQPDYVTPYGKTTVEDIKEVLDRILSYLEASTPAKLIDNVTGKEIKDFNNPGENAVFEAGDFRLISYEWGVTYAGMLLAAEITGDNRFCSYVEERLKLLADLFPYYKNVLTKKPSANSPVKTVVEPENLDDAGAMCAAMIKAVRAGKNLNLQPLINNYIDYISYKQYRFADGTLARNRPFPDTLWLDDLFMSVPALAQMGELSGEQKYFDDAVNQLLKFSERMFCREKRLFMHGWVSEMNPHPAFFWARANGWAVMAMVELLEVLPTEYWGREKVMELLTEHLKGLASYQAGSGFWHQLIDRNDTFTETSSTAIITYAVSRAMNRGWIDKKAFGPMALLAWNAVASMVTDKGQVEGTCVGSGMAFDPAFYYHRPVNVYAAHSYGPALLAGAEMIDFLNKNKYEINDCTVQFPSAIE